MTKDDMKRGITALKEQIARFEGATDLLKQCVDMVEALDGNGKGKALPKPKRQYRKHKKNQPLRCEMSIALLQLARDGLRIEEGKIGKRFKSVGYMRPYKKGQTALHRHAQSNCTTLVKGKWLVKIDETYNLTPKAEQYLRDKGLWTTPKAGKARV